MEDKFFYVFSYGSNLFLNRIINRTKSAIVIDTHRLNGFKIVFNKKSADGSAKANIVETKDISDFVWGVIHKIGITEKSILDKYEGLGNGYDYINFILSIEGEEKMIHSYIARSEQFLEEGKPYDWYLNFVIAGTIENNFPENYVNDLKLVESKKDLNEKRAKQNLAVLHE
ncbi:MAG: gamma-glutamylcyclotransferase [Bacteroidia bacterium]|jgi:hypothetical protein